jgi:EAL domain-containing protein (putative c-di-GMP-specific phosphodiesterase class I)
VAWAQAGHGLRISVNLSARQLRSAELLPDLAAALRTSGADPRQLQLEITESMLLGQDDELLALFQALQDLHLGLALDDFGTGYSNLAYLQRFPIDTLKIDKTFIQSLQNNRALAELIVSMARLMRLRVVAEGVETQEQLAWVRAQGIEFCQGYLFARPLPVADFSALLAG